MSYTPEEEREAFGFTMREFFDMNETEKKAALESLPPVAIGELIARGFIEGWRKGLSGE